MAGPPLWLSGGIAIITAIPVLLALGFGAVVDLADEPGQLAEVVLAELPGGRGHAASSVSSVNSSPMGLP